MKRRVVFLVGLAIVIAFSLSVGAAGGVPGSGGGSSVARRDTFLSLWPACACGRRTELDVFSLKTGRRLGRLARIGLPSGEIWTPPASVPGGPVLVTFSTPAACMPPLGGGVSFGPCDPIANSCTGGVERVDPRTGAMSQLLSIPSSTFVLDAVPSPRGQMLVMRSAGCDTSFFDAHLVVRDSRSGREWSIGADAPRCHRLSEASWSPDAKRLVFAYGPSILRYGTKPSSTQSCTEPRLSRLVVVPAGHASLSKSWRLIAADRRCSFEAAAFDRQGIAAVEGCPQGSRAPAGEVLGYAYLLQLDGHSQVTERFRLQPGWEEGVVSTEFRTGNVLISQDQPANSGYPERDWVWQFDGHHLRLIAHYHANDAAQVIAAPW